MLIPLYIKGKHYMKKAQWVLLSGITLQTGSDGNLNENIVPA